MGLVPDRLRAVALAASMLLASSPAAAQWGDHPVRCLKGSDDNGTTTTCICATGDRLWHDTNCDQVKDASERFINFEGPTAAVDEAITRYDGTSGTLVQDYASAPPTIDDEGIVNLGEVASASATARLNIKNAGDTPSPVAPDGFPSLGTPYLWFTADDITGGSDEANCVLSGCVMVEAGTSTQTRFDTGKQAGNTGFLFKDSEINGHDAIQQVSAGGDKDLAVGTGNYIAEQAVSGEMTVAAVYHPNGLGNDFIHIIGVGQGQSGDSIIHFPGASSTGRCRVVDNDADVEVMGDKDNQGGGARIMFLTRASDDTMECYGTDTTGLPVVYGTASESGDFIMNALLELDGTSQAPTGFQLAELVVYKDEMTDAQRDQLYQHFAQKYDLTEIPAGGGASGSGNGPLIGGFDGDGTRQFHVDAFGQVGVQLGGDGPAAPLHARGTVGEQMRLDYDSRNDCRFEVNSSGELTVDCTGDVVTFPDNVTFGTGLTEGSIPFIDSSGNLAEDNSDLFWDATDTQLGIGTTSPEGKVKILDTPGEGGLYLQSTDGTGSDTCLFFNSGQTPFASEWKVCIDESDGDRLYFFDDINDDFEMSIAQTGIVTFLLGSFLSEAANTATSFNFNNSTARSTGALLEVEDAGEPMLSIEADGTTSAEDNFRVRFDLDDKWGSSGDYTGYLRLGFHQADDWFDGLSGHYYELMSPASSPYAVVHGVEEVEYFRVDAQSENVVFAKPFNALVGGVYEGAVSVLGSITLPPRRNITAAGTTISDAFQLDCQVCQISTAASGTGVKAMSCAGAPNPTNGLFMSVANNGANTVKLYPNTASGDMGDGAGSGNPISIASGDIVVCSCYITDKWSCVMTTIPTS